jgi:predicted nucleic acid-binding protein
MTKNLLLDKNVVIDLIQGRSRKNKILEKLVEFDTTLISINTFVTCFYVLKKVGLSKTEIYEYLNDFELLEIEKSDCHRAYNLATNIDDIEDCLELFTAKRNQCKLMTADQKMILKYSDLFDIVEV